MVNFPDDFASRAGLAFTICPVILAILQPCTPSSLPRETAQPDLPSLPPANSPSALHFVRLDTRYTRLSVSLRLSQSHCYLLHPPGGPLVPFARLPTKMAPSGDERAPLLQNRPSEEPEDPTKLPKGRRNAILVAVWLGVLYVPPLLLEAMERLLTPSRCHAAWGRSMGRS